jgi:flavin reductase (DIM6/NTAB) family NADH-FMN oxidoreductase RutF
MKFDPKEISTGKLHGLMLGVIAPRPIAFASTVDKEGNVNLSPFSFFNVFSTNPPILIFSPARRVRDNTTKHTLENVLENPEVVINIVDHSIVDQMSLSSTEFGKGVDEFVKSGLTPIASDTVRPPRVAESPAAFECKVNDVIHLGDEGGAGNLIIAEVKMMHIKESVLDENEKPDPFKLDLVARMGGDYYTRVDSASLFTLPKPNSKIGIGYDNIHDSIRNSQVLTGNNLGRLGNITEIPDNEAVLAFAQSIEIQEVLKRFQNDKESLENHLHQLGKKYLESNDLEKAWLTLLQEIN